MSIPMVISLGGGYSFPSINLSVMTADATIIATTKAEIEAAINALPSNMGQYSIFLRCPDGSSASDYDFDIDVVNKHNGNFVFEAENALSVAGTNQPVEFIFDDPNKRINFINCNLTVIRDSIKFTGVENGQTVFADITNSKIGWIDRYCYDNLEACNQETIVLHGASASSNNGTFQGAADGSTTIYCSLENELNENVGDAVFIVDGTRNTIPFKHAGAGSGGVIVSNSSSAFEEDAIDANLIALTVHTWDAYAPIPQLNASVLSLTSVSDGQAVLAIADNNTSPNEGGRQLQYKLASEPTQWDDGVLEVTDALSITQTGLTNDSLYDFQLIDKGVALESQDSDPSNTIQATPVASEPVQLITPSLYVEVGVSGRAVCAWNNPNTDPNESSILLEYKLSTEPTTWTEVPLAADVVTHTLNGLTDDLDYNYRITVIGNGSSTLDSDVSNEVTRTITASLANMIQDGNFSQGATYWTVFTGWTFGTNIADYANSGAAILRQSNSNMLSSYLPNKTYDFDITVSDTSGALIWFGIRTADGIYYIAGTSYNNGTYNLSFTTPSDIGVGGIEIFAQGDEVGSITNLVSNPQ